MSRIPVDPDAIRPLAAILAETGLSEIEIADKDSRIRVARDAGRSTGARAGHRDDPGRRIRRCRRGGGGQRRAGGAGGRGHQPDGRRRLSLAGAGRAHLRHRRAERRRGADPAADRGDEDVQPDQGAAAGTVTRILVASGAPVEYGEALMVIELTGPRDSTACSRKS